jgi:hypothetical protein
MWQLVQQQFCATGIAGWNCAICLEFRSFSRKLECALEKMAVDQERFGGVSPDTGYMSEVQASWQTPASSAFEHMRAASETRREALLAKPGTSSSILLTYHCAVWAICGILTLSISLANFVVFASPAVLLADDSGMRVVVNVTQQAYASGRAAAGRADRRQALYLEAANSLALYLPFLLTILLGFGLVIFSWWRHRRLSRRLLHCAQPYYVAPTAGRLPLMIIMMCLLVPFALPAAKRLVDLGQMISDDRSSGSEEARIENNAVIRAKSGWGQLLQVIWAVSLGGQGVGTAGVGLMISLAKRAAVQAQPV